MKKKRSRSNKLKYLIIALLLIIFSLSAFIIGVLVGEKHTKTDKKEETITLLQNKIKALQKESILDKNKTNLHESKNETKYTNSEAIDYANAKKIIPPKPIKHTIKPKKEHKSHKPKLVIIIDDMAFKWEVNLLKQIPYKITPSFFPPTKVHPNTPKLAKEFNHYMVHMPMEAMHYPHPEPNTMNVNSSYAFIQKRVNLVKELFPNAKFINNHTGSKFTADYTAMSNLFKALKKDNLGFVDSRTTPYSKTEKVAEKIKIPIYSRNIFLDNKKNKQYIRNQLKKAIHLAKKYGYAIAIGHPTKITLTTLKNSKDLLSQVEVVYIDELKN